MRAELGKLSWRGAWRPVPSGLEVELRREVGPDHALAGRRAEAVARRIDNDDVLFHLPDGPAPLAVVHLTWSGQIERDPAWPGTTLYASVDDFVVRCMEPDARGKHTP